MKKETLKKFLLPTILLLVLVALIFFNQIFQVPSSEEILSSVESLLGTKGLFLIFVASLIEGFLVLGQYFPGGIVIFFSVIAAGRDIPSVALVLSIVSISFFIAYTLNYLIGKYGIYHIFVRFGFKKSLKKAEKFLEKNAFKTIAISYWDSNFASITATAAGILKISYKKFALYSSIAILIWNIFWGTIVYFLGTKALELVGFNYVILILLLWILYLLIKNFFPRKKRNV